MKMAIAVETFKHPERQSDYKIWFLNLGKKGDVIGIGVKTREELIQSLFQEYREYGRTRWRAFCKDSEASKPIEIFDFIAQNTCENTHFGNLPTLSEFQETLRHLQMNLEVTAIAS